MIAVTLAGCQQIAPGGTATLAVPTAQAVMATAEPTQDQAREAPTVEMPSAAPADTATEAPSATPAPTNTPTSTPTPTRLPVIRLPRPTATATPVPIKYPAPQTLEPQQGDSRVNGKDDFIFRWKPVADLEPEECYRVTVRVTNMADPGRRFAEVSWLPADTCGSSVGDDPVQFILYSQRHGQPYYDGLVEIASIGMPSNEYQVQWSVQAVLTDGTPVSPPSTPVQFTLFNQ